jgi:hypothetical protein
MRALLSNKEQSGEKDRQVGAAALSKVGCVLVFLHDDTKLLVKNPK